MQSAPAPAGTVPGPDPLLCEQEAIHIPGSIQPHGAMLAALADELLVTHASANLRAILGHDAEAALGQPLAAVIGEAACRAVLDAVPQDGSALGQICTLTGPDGALDLRACRGVAFTGNCLYGGYQNALWAEDSENLVLGANSIDHNPDYKGKSTDRVQLRGCRNVTLTGLLLENTGPAEQDPEASLTIDDCANVSLAGAQVIGARVRGVLVRGSSVVRVADCTVRPRPDDAGYRTAVQVDDNSSRVLVVNNFLAKGSDGDLRLPEAAGRAAGNLVV